MILITLNERLNKTFGFIEKRIRTLSSTLILTLGLLIATFISFNMWWLILPVLCIATFILTYFALLEGIEGVEWFTLFFIPLSLTIAFYLFFFLFPSRWITRILLLIGYGFSMYASILTSNIFNVGAEKSLQLFRAAFSINYLFQVFIIFLCNNVILSFKLHFILTSLCIGVILIPFGIQMVWSLKPKITIDSQIPVYAVIVAYITAQVVLASSFISIPLSMTSLLITAVYYCLIGLVYHYLDERLFRQTVREYIIVLSIVLLITLFTIS